MIVSPSRCYIFSHLTYDYFVPGHVFGSSSHFDGTKFIIMKLERQAG